MTAIAREENLASERCRGREHGPVLFGKAAESLRGGRLGGGHGESQPSDLPIEFRYAVGGFRANVAAGLLGHVAIHPAFMLPGEQQRHERTDGAVAFGR